MGRAQKNKRLFNSTDRVVGNPTDDKVSRKISKLVEEEDMPQDQAVAVAHSMAERGDL